MVIDPFSDNCIVITGSHNLGYRASHNNDENMVIIRGHRGLAEAYACHVLDIYDHYAWRFLLKQHPDIFGKPLEPDDKWQERYILGPDVKSPELRFWLAAASGGKAPPAPKTPPAPKAPPAAKAPTPAATGMGGKPAKPAKAKPAKTKQTRRKPKRGTAKKTGKKPPKKRAARVTKRKRPTKTKR